MRQSFRYRKLIIILWLVCRSSNCQINLQIKFFDHMVFVLVLRLVYMMNLYLEPIATTACIHTKPSNFKGWTAGIFTDLEKKYYHRLTNYIRKSMSKRFYDLYYQL